MIRDWLKTTYNLQKSYDDNTRRDLAFEELDKEYLKFSFMKGVMRFVKKGNLSPRYVGPYHIVQRAEKIVHELRLASERAFFHLIFHIYLLKKCIGDRVSILPIEY